MIERLDKSRQEMEIDARRRFILDAARRLMTSADIDEISMDEIAVAAQYTRRTLYAYFKSRDEILLQLYTEDLNVRWRMQEEAVKNGPTGIDKLLIWGRSFYAYAQQNPHSMRIQHYWDFKGIDRNRVSEEAFSAMERINDELADGLRRMFELGIADGSLRPDLAIDLCVSQFVYSLRAIFNRAMSTSYSFASFDPGTYVEHFLDLFCRGIRAKGVSNP